MDRFVDESMAVNVLLLLCGIFYAVLCVFSIVTGLMYASGKKELNPLELSDRFMSRYTDPDKLKRFTVKMGWVTFVVGIVQGITSYAILHRHNAVCYWIALGFTLFSIASVAWKLKGKINADKQIPDLCMDRVQERLGVLASPREVRSTFHKVIGGMFTEHFRC